MRSRTPDRLCAEAVELAREAAADAARPGTVGEHVGAVAEGDRVVTHLFECPEPGYRGWRWAVTVTRASRAKVVTLDETVLVPGPDALLAPEWVPWSERLRPGDMGPGDLLPTEAEDLRLEAGFSGEDVPPPNSMVSEEMEQLAAVEEADVTPGAPAAQGAPPATGSIASVAEELGMRRARVLSRYGLHVAADRWDDAFGARTPMAQAAPGTCASCGFLVPIAGSLRQAFGVCANEFSPADGRVVSLAYGCGAHSEAAVMPKPPRPAEPVLDETVVEPLPLHPDRTGGSVEPDSPAEELGHS
ncbi:DUF3027 domain-containing protein [Streptomyces coffeae]|uniref:DUF3027 domain-containing protein n=1 Tax=Streptomyces coffeae TaxID=621382 RepID=A0ABS1N5X5_9ACTN|nr:DUF3027 domain-containing protein [Streptomyces coffeae]MBL1095355.1 DUF3027 domain-containing protein [Streptomyces coffeae]